MKFGIRTQLVMLMTLPLFVVSLAIGSLMTSYRLGDLDRTLDKRGAELVEQLIRMSEFYLFSGDAEQLKILGDRILSLENVLAVEFLYPDKTLLVRSAAKNESNTTAKKSFASAVYSTGISVDDFGVSQPQGDLLLGYIGLDLSLSEKVRLKKIVIYRSVLITGLLMLFGATIACWFGYRLSMRLENITHSVEKLRAGILSTRCKEDANGEIKSLQVGINALAETIEHNDITLREQVEQATSALKHTVSELENKNTQLQLAREDAIKYERERVLVEERERIMQDMHDGIGGQLVSSMAILENYHHSGLDANSAYEEIRGLLRDCLDDLRLVIDSLDSSTDKLGVLMGMFRHRTQKRIESAGIQLKWDVVLLPENLAYSPQENLHILRIIQEAITNVIKHANADSLMFSVALDKDCVHICIRDNGRAQAEVAKGRGITNMHRRANELGAILHIEQTGQGRKIDLYLPIQDRNYKNH